MEEGCSARILTAEPATCTKCVNPPLEIEDTVPNPTIYRLKYLNVAEVLPRNLATSIQTTVAVVFFMMRNRSFIGRHFRF